MISFPSHWTEEQKQRFDVYLPYLGARRLMQEIPCIHVAGTNGKGSVCAMLESMLRQAGYRTGLFTSPHLYHETERILIDGPSYRAGLYARRDGTHSRDTAKRWLFRKNILLCNGGVCRFWL